MQTTIIIHHVAFGVGSTCYGKRTLTTPGVVIDTLIDTLREDAYAATNAPFEFMTGAQSDLIAGQKMRGRCYSTSVGDLIEVKDDAGHHSLAIVASVGFKTLASADVNDCATALLEGILKAWDDDQTGRGFFDLVARKHEVLDALVGK